MTYPRVPPGFAADRTGHVLGVFRGRALAGQAVAASQNAWAPTVYNGEGLIVCAADSRVASEIGAALRGVLDRHSCRPEGPSWLGLHSPEANHAGPAGGAGVLTAGVRIVPHLADAPDYHLPDPWNILEELRDRLGSRHVASVGLNHLMTSAEQIGGNPLAIGHGRVGLDGYGVTGSGHGPVALSLPTRYRAPAGPRPRVVVLDTGIGDHPWFADDPPETVVTFASGARFGPDIARSPNRADDEADSATLDPLLGTLPTHTGHGTFIAGLLRQTCPQAEIVALTVMQANGIVPEHKLIRALDVLLTRERQGRWSDAIVLSLGYYSESSEDAKYTSGLKNILLELGRLGVAVFAAAGNDATRRPSFPAALAIDPDFSDDEDVVPVVSVAAVNANGTLAAFSNDGDWVTARAPGVNLLSAAPELPDAAAEPAVSVVGPDGRVRSTVDPDDYRGYAVWSGTSFAAPILAGRYLQALVDKGFPTTAKERRAVLEPLCRRPMLRAAADRAAGIPE